MNVITLTAMQLKAALEFVAPDFDTDEDQRETQVCIAWGEAGTTHDDEGNPDPAGYRVWLTDYPEEGSMPLDSPLAGMEIKAVMSPPTQADNRKVGMDAEAV